MYYLVLSCGILNEARGNNVLLPVYSCAAGKLEMYPALAEMALRFLAEGTVLFHTDTRSTSFLILNKSPLSTEVVTIAHTTTSYSPQIRSWEVPPISESHNLS